jgi:hypothetical protein
VSSSRTSSARVPPLGGVEANPQVDRTLTLGDDVVTRMNLRGWESTQRQTAQGAVESEQRVRLPGPVVDGSLNGALRLGWAYWQEVERCTFGLVRARQDIDGVQLRLLGWRPLLLAFGRPVVDVAGGSPRCCYPITGGLLAREPAGHILFGQERAGDQLRLRSAITGFFPALAARPGEPDWTGALYSQVQRRVHLAISRRYFTRLIRQAGR